MVDNTKRSVAGSSDKNQTRRSFMQGVGATGVLGAIGSPANGLAPEFEKNSSPGRGKNSPPGLNKNEEGVPEWLKFVVEQNMPQEGLNGWVPTDSFDTSAFARVARFPQEFGDVNKTDLSLIGVRNEQISGQLAVLSSDPIEELSCSVSDLTTGTGSQIPADEINVRYVGYVPVENAGSEYSWSATIEEVTGKFLGTRDPDLVGDPLIETDNVPVPEYQAQPIWFTIDVPKTASPGTYKGEITVDAGKQGSIDYSLDLTVYDVALPDPQDYEFYLDIWMNSTVIADEYSANSNANNVKPWSDRHWELIEAYMRDMAERGQKSVTTIIMPEPWHIPWLEGTTHPSTESGYESMIKWQYDGDEWSFDFSIFDRFVETGLEQGMGPDISAYSMLTFRGLQRITYLDEREGEQVVWKGETGEEFWEEAWTAFLNAFKPHLEQKGWLDRTYIAFDERPEELMQDVLALLEDVAPVFLDQIHIAGGSDIEGIADNFAAHYNVLPFDEETVDRRRDNGKVTSYYTAGGQAHPNTFSFSPPAEARMLPWISALNNLDGYLRWAYNSWPNNVYEDPVFNYTQGDEYFVYPGEDGPVSSLSWEQLTEGIEDYELVQMLQEKTGRDTAVLEEAFELATRDRDAREKDLHDIVEAKKLVLDELV